ATDAGTTYVHDAITGAFLHTLNNPSPEIREFYGNSVSVSGNTAYL
ncbi:MAG: hypothetical protein ACJA1F_003349, partial [Paracoccaceae bacterium]